MASRRGSKDHYFTIGIFETYEKAMDAASVHYYYRGYKYDHTVYKLLLDEQYDDQESPIAAKPEDVLKYAKQRGP